MKPIKCTSVLLILLIFCILAAGCSKSNTSGSSDTNSDTNSDTTTPSSQITSKNVEELIEELVKAKAAPSEFIKLAKDHVETSDSDTVRLFMQAIFQAQKDYSKEVEALYEIANSDSNFSTVYILDITPDLANDITDESIKKTVEESYANGFKLVKQEGYVFPIIDIEVYETFFTSYLTDSDKNSLKEEIEAFNKTL